MLLGAQRRVLPLFDVRLLKEEIQFVERSEECIAQNRIVLLDLPCPRQFFVFADFYLSAAVLMAHEVSLVEVMHGFIRHRQLNPPYEHVFRIIG